jgi:membrane protease YdiL (CAAX protease family)
MKTELDTDRPAAVKTKSLGPLAQATALDVAERRGQLKPILILLLSSLLLLGWKYCGSEAFYREYVAPRFALGSDPAMAAAWYRFLTCFLGLGVLPALIVKCVFRERLSDYGVRLGIAKRTVRSFLLAAPAFVLAGYLASRGPAFQAVYPLNRNAGASADLFALHLLCYFMFYVGWEFYFRGFMLIGLRDSLGPANAVLVQVLASSLLHIGCPAAETFGSIAAGLFWGFLALRTRSLLSGLLQHSLLGMSLDWFLCFGGSRCG